MTATRVNGCAARWYVEKVLRMNIVNRFIKKLSQIAIDTDKDWGGYQISNVVKLANA